MEHTIYAVIVDPISTDITKLKPSGDLSELDADGIRGICEMLAENSAAWQDVLDGTRSGVLFDGETLRSIRINDEISRNSTR